MALYLCARMIQLFPMLHVSCAQTQFLHISLWQDQTLIISTSDGVWFHFETEILNCTFFDETHFSKEFFRSTVDVDSILLY